MSKNLLRAARALLGLSQAELAEIVGVSVPTIKRAEGKSKTPVSDEVIEAMKWALVREGVEFIPENGGGAGVRLRKDTK